ncbi:hypothetical protein VKT23_014704 [Stygiomarasmius scandens]|uniref:NADH dehydrogenase subunit 6 n=1 Tax=Marasmiellus scandens TaxID=2682957 RepID=A0ABR1J0X7_9AGAR
MARTKTGDVIGACLGGVTFIGSLVIMGFAASIIAHDHKSKVGIAHLVLSLVSLGFLFMWFIIVLSSAEGEERASIAQPMAAFVIFITMLMYLGGVIAIAVDHTSRQDYLRGQHQFLKGPDNNGVSTALSDHPYYGMFFFDILTIVFSFLSLLCTCC